MTPTIGERIRAAHHQHLASITLADLTATETDMVFKPQGNDWAAVRSRWDPTCTNYNPATRTSLETANCWFDLWDESE